MSSSWGLTEMVLEGRVANDVYALLCRAKEECASEDRDHCSQVIHTAKGDFCFALGLENIFEDTGDAYWGPAVKETVPREDIFMLFAYPFDRSSRCFTDSGNIEYEYDGAVLRINEDTYADEGMMLQLIYALLGEDCPGLYFRISSEADYIGETNDMEGKYFRLEENFEDTHWGRTELQYFYIPKLVDAVNEGYLPFTALYVVDEWDFWEEYDREEGFYVNRLEVGKDHTVICYNFPEPKQIPEALYGAVLINNISGKAKYYTLEYGYLDSWILGSKTLKGHRNYGTLDSREHSVFLKWVTDRIADPK